MPASPLPVLLAIHVTLAVGLFLPSLLLPFALRARRQATTSETRVVQALLWLQSHGKRQARQTLWVGWRGRIRTFNPLIQSQVPYR